MEKRKKVSTHNDSGDDADDDAAFFNFNIETAKKCLLNGNSNVTSYYVFQSDVI